MASQPVGPGEVPSRMLQLLNSFVTVQALHVAAALGISDLLADGPMTLDDLAAATGTHAPSLYRLLRMLTGAEVFREEADGRFALAALGGTLRSEGLTRSAIGRSSSAGRSCGAPGAACAKAW